MLILTRKLGESIAIGDEIKITLLEIKGRQIKIGVDAPARVAVHRAEVYRLIHEQNAEAAQSASKDREHLSRIWGTLGEMTGP